MLRSYLADVTAAQLWLVTFVNYERGANNFCQKFCKIKTLSNGALNKGGSCTPIP